MRGELLRLTLVQLDFDRWANDYRIFGSILLGRHLQDHVPAQQREDQIRRPRRQERR
jgi:hypothetical protein